MHQALSRLRLELETELQQAILPWWPRFRDLQHGGFPGLIRNDGSTDPKHDKGVVMHARFLWTYAAAYRHYGDASCLPVARHALEFLTGPLQDKAHGGFFWQVSHDGRPVTERKVIYGQAFAIYALAEWYRATGDTAALELALQTFQLMEKQARDPQYGGYFEACAPDWSAVVSSALSDVDIACAKSMNTNLHVMEAQTCLLAALRERPHGAPALAAQVQEALQSLVNVHIDHIRTSPAHLGLYYDADWKSLSSTLSYGHDIEGSWLLTEAAELAWDGVLPGKVREAALTIARRTIEIIKQFGPGLIHEGPAPHLDTNRVWWVQAECLVGLLNAATLNPDAAFIQEALQIWEYIKTKVKDPVNGEWFWNTKADGSHDDQPKGGLWKTSYHNGRACLEGMHRIDLLNQRAH